MDELSIFVVNDIDWHHFVTTLAGVLNAAGTDMSDEEDLRHQWTIDDFEITAIESPGYEDDCGIPFAKYSHQVVFLDANATSDEFRIYRYGDLVKSVARSLDDVIPNEIVIVKNLQSLVPVRSKTSEA